MKLIVWDFHGVLERGTEHAVYEISNLALQELGYSARFSKVFCDAHYGKKWFRYFKELMPDLPLEKCYELQQFCIDFSDENPEITERHIQPHPHAQQILKTISERGHKQILISNAHHDFLMHYLILLGLDRSFDQIFSNGNPLAKKTEKVDVLETYLQQADEEYKEIIAIDDLPDNLSFKKIPRVKFCLYRHAPPFPECSADHFTHDLQEVVSAFSL